MTAHASTAEAQTQRHIPRIALREQEAADAFGISLGTFLALVKEGKLPRPTYVRPRIPLYDLTKLETAWRDLQEDGAADQDNPWDE